MLILNEALKKRFGNTLILLVGVQEGIGDMVELVKPGAKIENPREYELGAVEHLRHLLEIGSPAQRDPQREDFYEIESHHENYYIHVSPISGNVVLLAKWLRQPQGCCFSLGHLVA